MVEFMGQMRSKLSSCDLSKAARDEVMAGGQVEMAVAWTVNEDGERISWPNQVMLAEVDEIEVLCLPRHNRVGVTVGAGISWGFGTSINDGLGLWHDLFLEMYAEGPW